MKEMLVGAVGIELKAMLKTRKLLIPLNEKNDKNTEFTQVRYTPGTRSVNSLRRKNNPSEASCTNLRSVEVGNSPNLRVPILQFQI